MAKFLFQLEGVLRHRQHVEREKQRAFAQRSAVVAALTKELREMDRQLQTATSDLRQNRLTGAIDLSFLAAHRRYALSMQRRAIEQARKIAQAQQLAEAAQAELVAAARDRKIIEKLRERRYSQWQAEQARKEAVQLDEIGIQMGSSQ
jgi:flagellar protein FliJ